MASRFQQVYCAFCRSSRKIPTTRFCHWGHVAVAICLGFALMYVFAQQLHWIFAPLSITCLATMEMLLRVRWRSSIICQHCGFDPITYQRNPEKACETVRVRLAQRATDPNVQLTRHARLDIPVKKIRKEKWAHLSKHV